MHNQHHICTADQGLKLKRHGIKMKHPTYLHCSDGTLLYTAMYSQVPKSETVRFTVAEMGVMLGSHVAGVYFKRNRWQSEFDPNKGSKGEYHYQYHANEAEARATLLLFLLSHG